MGNFNTLTDLPPYQIWTGVIARAVHGDRLTMAVVELDPNQAVPEHSHDNEQLGFVIKGAITMTVAGEARRLGPGETYSIPSNTPHEAMSGPQGAVVVDVFAPVRSDWESVERLTPRRGAWPG